jgi:putative transposase
MIPHCAWLYLRFCLGHRDAEELMLARGVIVTYEAIRKWCRKFGQTYAKELRCRRPQPGDTWHLDEVFLTIKGTRHCLWRELDPDGNDLDILAQHRCDKAAVKTFLRASLKGLSDVPRVIITAKLANYGVRSGRCGPLGISSAPISQASGRKFSPANPPAVTARAAVHVCGLGAALSGYVRAHHFALPSSPAPPS